MNKVKDNVMKGIIMSSAMDIIEKSKDKTPVVKTKYDEAAILKAKEKRARKAEKNSKPQLPKVEKRELTKDEFFGPTDGSLLHHYKGQK